MKVNQEIKMRKNKFPVLSEYVQLKRKRFWVTRYAILFEDKLAYTENEDDISMRREYLLSDVNIQDIKELNRKIIEIRRKDNQETILICSKNHQIWMKKLKLFKMNQMKDDVISGYQLQPHEISLMIEKGIKHEQDNINSIKITSLEDSTLSQFDKQIIGSDLIPNKNVHFRKLLSHQVLSPLEIEKKVLVQVTSNLQVFQFDKQSASSVYLKPLFIIKDLAIEQFTAKMFALVIITLLYMSQLYFPLLLAIVGFYILFIQGTNSRFISENIFSYEISGYLKCNINEFLKYIEKKEKTSSFSFRNVQEGNQIVIEVTDHTNTGRKSVFNIICTFSILESYIFEVSCICKGPQYAFQTLTKFFDTCESEIKQMQRNTKSELFSHLRPNLQNILRKSNMLNKYPLSCSISNEDKNIKIEDNPQIIPLEEIRLMNQPESFSKVQQYQTQLLEISEKMMQLQELSQENKWELIKQDKNYKVHKKFDHSLGLVYCRGESKVPCSLNELTNFLLDVQNNKHINVYFDYGEVVEQISQNIQIVYVLTKKVFIVKPRDVLGIQGLVQIGNKVTFIFITTPSNLFYQNLICCQSLGDVERPPNKKDTVRADLILGGFLLESVSPHETNCVYVVCSDPKGLIPQFVKEIGMKEQAYIPNIIRKYFIKNQTKML